MSKLFIEDSSLTAIGNAIRAKTGGTSLLTVPSGMVAAINSISAESGGGSTPDSGTSAIIQELNVTTNGTYTAPSGVDGYSPVIVNVAGVSEPVLEDITISANGTYTPPTGIDGYDSIIVNVPTSPSGDDVKSLVNQTITSYSDDKVEIIRRYIFQGCYCLTSIDIPNAKEIEEYALMTCGALYNVNAPLVETIGKEAFSRAVPNADERFIAEFPKVNNIEDYVFFSNRNLGRADFPLAKTIGSNAFRYCDNLTEVNFPLVTLIGDYAFDNCEQLINFNFPMAETIDICAFEYCDKAKYASFPKVTFIGEKAFYYCNELQSINALLVQSIGKFAFSSCQALTSVNFPNVTNLGVSVFASSGIRSAYLPEMTTIPTNTFRYCDSLEDVDISKATSIGQFSFDSCKALTTLDLPLVQSIDNYAFLNCISLTSLILRNNTMCILSGTGAFQLSTIADGTGYIYVPAALIDDYKAATNWITFASQFRALEDYTVDGTTTGALDETKI